MIVVAEPDRRSRMELRERLSTLSEVMEVAELTEVEDLINGDDAETEVIVLGPTVELDRSLKLAERLQVESPSVSVLLFVRDPGPELFRQALRSGIRDVLKADADAEQVRDAVGRALGLSRQLRGRDATDHDARGDHQVITVFSTKGGSGKSLVASNLAVLLHQQTNEPVALVDLDLQSGDLAIMFQVLPAYTVHDAAGEPDRLDHDALEGYLTQHQSGIRLLAAPAEPSLAEHISPAAVTRILDLLAEVYSYVVVDGPGMFTDQVLAALDESNTCVLVGSMDVPSIKNLKLAFQTLQQLGFSRDRIKTVLNRADSRVGLQIQEVEKALGAKIDVAVPSSRDVPVSVNQGEPLAVGNSKSAVVTALAQLADDLRIHERQNRRRSGLFRRS